MQTSYVAEVQPAQKFGGAKMFDFRRITLFCLENASQSTKWLLFPKIWGGPWPLLPPPGYAYAT